MIEKKYRAWLLNTWVYHTLEELVNGIGDYNDYEHWSHYIGIKTKSGDEIYEGDILNVPMVEYLNGKTYRHWVVRWSEHGEAKYLAIRLPEEAVNTRMDASCIRHGEIIGNIFLNPELLKVKE